ncbi:MAG: TonB-dependent receptor [Tannerellaceae bacterium]|nr:TonB-dependent receptor [Tannerellaceae bacterium]
MNYTQTNLFSGTENTKKGWICLRLVCILCCLGVYPLFAADQYAPSKKLTIVTTQSTPLAEILKEVEKQSEFLFNYKDSDISSVNARVNVTEGSIQDVLEQALRGSGLTYVIEDRHITLSVLPANQTNIPVTGIILDAYNDPLTGVSIVIKGEGRGTITDLDGRFSLEVPQGSVLTVSFICYQKQEFTIRDNRPLTIRLQEEFTDLDEVVVVGYGTQKKVNLTGSIGIISSRELALKPVGQTSTALQGLLPGVTVTQSSGQPGEDGGQIRIRGIGTLSDANPLVLIDGVEGSINNIDPNSIESISVLKDAASSSIYGSRAANGVVLVTTKRGGESRYKVSYSNYVGWQKPTDMPDLVDAVGYMELLNVAYQNVGRDPLYSTELIDAYKKQNGVSSNLYPDTDWQKVAMKGSALQQNHFINVSGGNDKLRMFTSAGYFSQQGLLDNTDFRRFTLRNNMDWILSSRLSVRLDLQFIHSRRSTPGTAPNELFQWINGLPSNLPYQNEDGTWGVGWNGANPVAHAKESGRNVYRTPWGSVNAAVIYKPVEWITAEVNVAPKFVMSDENKLKTPIQTYLADGTPSYVNPSKSELTESHSRELYNNFRATVTAEKTFARKHDTKLMVGFTQEDYKNNNFYAYRDSVNVLYPVLNTGGAANRNNGGKAEEWALRSWFGRVNYAYNQRYLVEFNLRYDGSSRFAKENRYALFPSVSAGWRISEETFMQGTKGFLDDAKIRASWGRLGNQNIGTYPFTSSVEFGIGAMDGNSVSAAALNDMPNAQIKWETTETTNIGLDLVMLGNRLTVTGEYYKRRTEDILLKLNIPLIVGLGNPYQNAGIVENKGWELSIGYRDRAGDLNYSVHFNLSDVKNKIIDLRGQDETGLQANREGHPVGAIYGYIADGYFQSEEEIASHPTQFGSVKPGDIKYRNLNGDDVIDGEDKVVIGNVIPRYSFGLNVTAEYKGFDINAFFQGVGKRDGYLWGAGITPFTTSGAVGGTIREDNRDYWTENNRNARYPRLAFGETNNTQYSTFWMQDAKYIRLKNLQIGYTVPASLVHKVGMERFRIYANGTNLFTIDKFLKGYDVEAPVGVGNYYPQTRLFSFGLELVF